MPDTGLPSWARVTGRVLRVAVYAMGVVVGVGDLWHRSPVIADTVGEPWVLASGWVAIVAGTVGVAAVVAWRWRWEYVATCALALALSVRAVGVWAGVDDVAYRLAPAAGMTIAVLACALRGLDLTIFAIRTTAAALAAGRRRG